MINLFRLLYYERFFSSVAGMHQSLYISNERLVKKAGETVVVTCKDEKDPKTVVKWSRDNGLYRGMQGAGIFQCAEKYGAARPSVVLNYTTS